MASFWSFLAMLMAMLACSCSLALASSSQQSMQVTSITAAPASAPLVSPTQSPDIEPLFPTPGAGGVSHSPSYSSLPQFLQARALLIPTQKSWALQALCWILCHLRLLLSTILISPYIQFHV
ncbi:hypothetical protein GLYMA_03G209000v4 [Glycine max]|uniref:Uncharacterized protein n=1 Tax=Glycine max TaxID=3847 RepID=A0A0R0KTW7_SOYBN|nr:hypothetical protein GLYMA_03G209000v4 [Glycine max]